MSGAILHPPLPFPVSLPPFARGYSMKYHTDDVRITGMEEVLPPEALLADLPISDAASQLVFTRASRAQRHHSRPRPAT